MSTEHIVYNLPGLRKLYPAYRLEYHSKTFDVRLIEKLAAVAKQEDPRLCLVAWSLSLKLADGYDPYTFKTNTYIVDHNTKRILGFQHSRSLRDAIDYFDKTGRVLAGTYRMIPVSESKRSGVKAPGRRTPGTGTTDRVMRPAVQTPRTYRKAVVDVADEDT